MNLFIKMLGGIHITEVLYDRYGPCGPQFVRILTIPSLGVIFNPFSEFIKILKKPYNESDSDDFDKNKENNGNQLFYCEIQPPDDCFEVPPDIIEDLNEIIKAKEEYNKALAEITQKYEEKKLKFKDSKGGLWVSEVLVEQKGDGDRYKKNLYPRNTVIYKNFIIYEPKPPFQKATWWQPYLEQIKEFISSHI